MEKRLSRLDITGKIDENTPLCVLEEIMESHGCVGPNYKINNIREILNIIKNKEVPSINEKKSKRDWEFIARFVNVNVTSWTVDHLAEAFVFLNKFKDSGDVLKELPKKFEIGQQTPDKIRSINACILYKICRQYEIRLKHSTTIQEMRSYIKFLRKSDNFILKSLRGAIEDKNKRAKIIKFLAQCSEEHGSGSGSRSGSDSEKESDKEEFYEKYPSEITNSGKLSEIIGPLNNISDLRLLINPQTIDGSIALSALNYKIDISRAKNPIKEYNNIKSLSLPRTQSKYLPNDKWMLYWYKKNAKMFDLKEFFNPIFPRSYYDNDDLLNLIKKEGYLLQQINGTNCYELLQEIYLSKTFYSGELPNIARKETMIDLEDISKVPEGELFTFGVICVKLEPITINELIHTFSCMGFFINPFDLNSSLSVNSINKLKILLRAVDKKFSQDTLKLRMKLLEVINTIELKTAKMDDPTRNLCSHFKNSSPDTKSVIINCLNKLLELALYMRGWDGKNKNYPISGSSVPDEQLGEVFINVSKSISEYENLCRCLGKIGSLINSLPLVKHNDGKYYPSLDVKDGITISDRINLVKQGTETPNMESCIRLSSNWLLASSHKYLIAIGQPSPFDIFYLRHIS